MDIYSIMKHWMTYQIKIKQKDGTWLCVPVFKTVKVNGDEIIAEFNDALDVSTLQSALQNNQCNIGPAFDSVTIDGNIYRAKISMEYKKMLFEKDIEENGCIVQLTRNDEK